jgi:hypothetical protein
MFLRRDAILKSLKYEREKALPDDCASTPKRVGVFSKLMHICNPIVCDCWWMCLIVRIMHGMNNIKCLCPCSQEPATYSDLKTDESSPFPFDLTLDVIPRDL